MACRLEPWLLHPTCVLYMLLLRLLLLPLALHLVVGGRLSFVHHLRLPLRPRRCGLLGLYPPPLPHPRLALPLPLHLLLLLV